MDPTWLALSALFSLIGFAASVYGRRQRLVVPAILGVLLMVYPYFVSSMVGLVGIGTLLVAGVVIGARMQT